MFKLFDDFYNKIKNLQVNLNHKNQYSTENKTSMKTLIAFCTTHGCTEKTAHELEKYLGVETQLCNLKKDKIPNLGDFDRIVIGGSIHAGRIQKRVKAFCTQNLEILKKKELGLFICCMEEGETAQKELMNAFPEELHKVARASAYFGGEFNLNKMNFFEKLIVKKVAHVEESISKINHSEIVSFSEKMDRAFNPFLFLS